MSDYIHLLYYFLIVVVVAVLTFLGKIPVEVFVGALGVTIGLPVTFPKLGQNP